MSLLVPISKHIVDDFIAVGGVSCHALTTIRPGQLIFSNKLAVWALSFFSLTLTLNATCTVLISSRLWYVLISSRLWYTSRAVTGVHSGENRLWRVAMIVSVVQSAM